MRENTRENTREKTQVYGKNNDSILHVFINIFWGGTKETKETNLEDEIRHVQANENKYVIHNLEQATQPEVKSTGKSGKHNNKKTQNVVTHIEVTRKQKNEKFIQNEGKQNDEIQEK